MPAEVHLQLVRRKLGHPHEALEEPFLRTVMDKHNPNKPEPFLNAAQLTSSLLPFPKSLGYPKLGCGRVFRKWGCYGKS